MGMLQGEWGRRSSLLSWIYLEITPEQDRAEQACQAVNSLVVTQACTFRAGEPLYIYQEEENVM